MPATLLQILGLLLVLAGGAVAGLAWLLMAAGAVAVYVGAAIDSHGGE